MRRGRGVDRRPTERRYVAFVGTVELARAQAEAEAVETIWQALPHRPDVARWFLAVRSEEWRRDRLRPTPSTVLPVPAEPSTRSVSGVAMIVPVDEMRRMVREFNAARERTSGA